jgi:hypothetical protein
VKLRVSRRRLLTLLAVVLVGLFAATPLLDPRLPEAHDVGYHLFRLVQLDSLFRRGVLFSRWAPELAYGYGYPLFNYYAPAVYYLAELLHLLGLTFPAALRATFALTLLGAAVGMYLWVRDLFGRRAGLVAAAAYAFAPYLTITLLYRGSLAELAALALLPFILWALQRFVLRGSGGHGVVALLLYALLILTHNITALLFTAVMLAYVLVLAAAAVAGEEENARRALWSVASRSLPLLLLGLGLTAFFWLPALAERDLVKIHQLYLPTAYRYADNFLSLRDIFTPPQAADPRMVYQPRPMSLGLLALLIALPSVLWRRRDRLRAGVVILASLGTLVTIFLMLPLSLPLWERLPLIHFLQFPWRFLGLSSLFVALLVGAGTAELLRLCPKRLRLRPLLPALLVATLALYLIPLQYMLRYPPFGALTMRESVQFERSTGSLGTTAMGEFLPRVVQTLPEERSPALESGERLDVTSLPEGARVVAADYAPLRYTLDLESPVPFTARFYTFDFPGWRAEIDGSPVPISPSEPHGLITVRVPAGRHTLTVRFGPTPVRTWGTLISAVSLLLFLALLVGMGRRRRGLLPLGELLAPEPRGRVASALVLLALAALLPFKLLYVDAEGRQSLFRRTRFDGQSVAGVDVPLRANFAEQLHLLGVDRPAAVPSGGTADVALYWRVPAPVDQEYSVALALVDERGFRYGQSDHQHPGGYPPTTRWDPSSYARDPHRLPIFAGTPPGTYTLQVSVYPYGEPERTLDVLNEVGAPVGRLLPAAELVVLRPQEPSSLAALAPTTSTLVALDGALTLLGYDLPTRHLRAGETVPLLLYWEATQGSLEDLELRLDLHTHAGDVVVSQIAPPVVGYPTSEWRAGDRWRGAHRLLLPPDLESGTYTLTVGLPGGGETIDLGRLEITAPDHLMEPPEVMQEVGGTLGGLATLYGYDLTPVDVHPGQVLSTTLVWQVEDETRESYKSFVHLLRDDGSRAAGSDAVPGGWQRPTTGWVEGEYVVDRHTFSVPADLPPGTYRLQAGLYDEGSGTRLRTEEGADTILLPTPLTVLP